MLAIYLKETLLMPRTIVVTQTMNLMAHGAIQQILTPDGNIVMLNFVQMQVNVNASKEGWKQNCTQTEISWLTKQFRTWSYFPSALAMKTLTKTS